MWSWGLCERVRCPSLSWSVCESGSAGGSRIADCTELHITFGGSEVFEPLDDVFAGVPAAFIFRAVSGRCAAFDRFAFHGRVDL